MSARAAFQIPDLHRDRPTVPEVLPLVRALYRRHGAGCCWHVVLDDGNAERATVAWCAAQLETQPCEAGPTSECHALAKLLPLMSPTQVRKLSALSFVPHPGPTLRGYVTAYGIGRQ